MSPVEGSRFGTNRPAPAAILWHCPACGQEQSGPVELGCASCGNGQPGRHSGETTPAGKRPIEDASGHSSSILDQAFTAWHKEQPAVEKKIFVERWTAFKAGWEIAMGQLQTAQSSSPLTGTIQSRTIRAALEFFREQILTAQPEEVTTGEWLSAEAVTEMLREYPV